MKRGASKNLRGGPPRPAPQRGRLRVLLLLGAVAALGAGWMWKEPVLLWYLRHGPIAGLESYAAERPDSVDAALALGEAYLRTGRARDAVDHLEPMVTRYPAHPRLRVLLAEALVESGETARGYAALELAVYSLGVKDPDVLVLLGRLEAGAGHGDRSRAHYELALKTNPQHLPALLELARLADNDLQYPMALAEYQRAAAVDPRSAVAAAGIAGDAYHLGRLDEAAAQARRAVALAPNARSGNLWLGRTLQALGPKRYGAEAEAAYRRAIAASHPSYEERYYFAQLLRLEGKLPEAEAELEEDLKENVYYTPSYYELAICARALGQKARAEKAMARFKHLDKVDLGSSHLEYQLSAKPNDVALQLKLAKYYFTTGRPDLARTEVMKVLKKRPNDTAARALLATIVAHPEPSL